MIKLFVGGFPLDIEEIELAKLFGMHGDISTLKIVRDKKTRTCKGYAFIEMKDRTGAENAVEALDGTVLAGKPLTVKINEEAPAPPAYRPTQTRNPVYQKVSRPGNDPERKKRPRKIV